MSELTTSFRVYGNKISGAIPTQIGNLVKITSAMQLNENKFSGTVPTHVGQWGVLNTLLQMFDNKLCGDVPEEVRFALPPPPLSSLPSLMLPPPVVPPMNDAISIFLCDFRTQLSALSRHFTGDFKITTSNYFGTPCCEALPDTFTCSPTAVPTPQPTISPFPTEVLKSSTQTPHRHFQPRRCHVVSCWASTYHSCSLLPW